MAGNLTAMIAAIFSSSAAIPDPYFEYTTLLLPGSGTNGAQNNTFLDASTNNFTITRNGNTTQGTFSPFSQTGWGNYFDGSGDYLTAPNNAAFGFGASDFTIEAWIFPTAFSGFNSVFCVNVSGGLFFGALNGTTSFGLRAAAVSDILTATSPSLNTWTHVAVTRSGVNVYLFYNGVQQATTTSSYSFAQSSIGIGSDGGNSSLFTGYISNLRVIKGQALYTSAFTPSTTSLTTTSQGATAGNVSLLTCQSNRFIDNSTNNFTITRNGDTRVVAFSPFNPTASWSAATYGGSGYFDGSGDYLSASNASLAFGNSNFTLECWVYATSTPTDVGIFEGRNLGSGTSGFTITAFNSTTIRIFSGSPLITSGSINYLNTWCHVAVERVSGTTTLYINGQSQGTTTSLGNLTDFSFIVGAGIYSVAPTPSAFFPGYISNFRIVKGSAVYNGNFTPPTAPLTAITNTSLLLNFTNAGIYDATSKNDLETVGNAQISTTQSKWGGSSMYFDGSGDYLVVGNMATNPILALLAGDFTIEWWYYPLNTNTHGILTNLNDSDGTGSLWILTNGTFSGGSKVQFGYNTGSSGNILFGTGTFTINNWYHVAVCRSGINLRCFINGTQEGSTSTALGSGSITSYNRNLVTGATLNNVSYTAYNLNGYIQDLRVTKGYARYTANFTPPTAAFPTL